MVTFTNLKFRLVTPYRSLVIDNLFPDELKVLTDESGNENGSSCFKKIPTCCQFLGVDTLNIREYLEFITDGKIELIIKEG